MEIEDYIRLSVFSIHSIDAGLQQLSWTDEFGVHFHACWYEYCFESILCVAIPAFRSELAILSSLLQCFSVTVLCSEQYSDWMRAYCFSAQIQGQQRDSSVTAMKESFLLAFLDDPEQVTWEQKGSIIFRLSGEHIEGWEVLRALQKCVTCYPDFLALCC